MLPSASSKHVSDLCKLRITKEYKSIVANPIPNVEVVYHKNDNLCWYCRIYDLGEAEHQYGEYIFNIKLSKKYPFEPPDFYILTPNARFSINTKICFSNSKFHKEEWSPIWTLKTLIMGFLSLFLEKETVGIGHLKPISLLEKQELALASKTFNQTHLSEIMHLFPSSL